MLNTHDNIKHHTTDMLRAKLFGKHEESSSTPISLQDIVSAPSFLSSPTEDVVIKVSQQTPNLTPMSKKPLPLSYEKFPHLIATSKQGTVENIEYMLTGYSISVSYNVIKKKILITLPDTTFSVDNADNAALATIISLAILNNLSTGQIPSYLEIIADKNRTNPVADWINSVVWDGVDRLQVFYDTLETEPDYAIALKRILMYRWALSAVAAALKPSGFKARGVLTLQGPQGIGKTSWISSLLTGDIVKEGVLKLDHHLDAGNKDSIMTAVSHWIVEIGELDSSFRRDVARLKSFLTGEVDKLRRPYAKADSTYPRRTVFCATVNEHNFLVDPTGNSRWWTIPVVSINYKHGIDTQQLFAQLAVDFHTGEQWWLTHQEEKLLEEHNKEHRAVSVIREHVLAALDIDHIGQANLEAFTPISLLSKLGITNPTNKQCQECGSVLREYIGEPKKINGYMKWRFPFKSNPLLQPHLSNPTSSTPLVDDDDGY